MEKEQILKRTIDKVTAPLYQALNDIELAQATENIETHNYFFNCIKAEIEKSITEYVRSTEK